MNKDIRKKILTELENFTDWQTKAFEQTLISRVVLIGGLVLVFYSQKRRTL